jgi:hypothetical protein
VNKLIGTVVLVGVGLVVLSVASPTLNELISSAVWLVVAVGLIVCVIRLVWAATRRW